MGQKKPKNNEKTEFKGSPEKIMEIADDLYRLQAFARAKEAYVEVLKKDPENYIATVRVAKCSYFIQEYDEAARYFESALEIDKNKNDTVYFELGMTYRVLDRQNDALENFMEFRKRWREKDDYARRVKLEIEGCKFAEEERKKDPMWRTRCLDLNTAMGENFPAVLSQNEDEQYLVFTTSRTESKNNEIFEGYNEGYSDLWLAKIEDDTTFAVAENMGKKINTKYNDGNPTFTADGMTMYFSICNQGKLGYGCSIYRSEYDPRKKAWGKPRRVEELNGTKDVVVDSRGKIKRVPTYDVHPMLSADGNLIFFSSDRDGGSGRQDLWYATWEGDKWSDPQNLGARLNTPFDDISPIWSKDDSSTYFASNRPGCVGRDDIYWAKKKEEDPCEFAVHGLVTDKKTQLAVPFATVILFEIDFEGDLIPLDTARTDQSAEYNFEVECEKEYKVLGNAPEYLANEETFSTKGAKGVNDLELNINIELERIILEKPIILNNIYYDFDKFDLRDASKDELNNLIELLKANGNISIQMGSHTDSNGSESYNKELSENRAKEAVKYLIENGISPNRLKWFGFGESQLIYFPEKNDQEEQMNRRTEFQILSIEYEGE